MDQRKVGNIRGYDQPSMADYRMHLGVRADASPQELKAAYKQASLRYHPDHGGSAEQFQKAADAYDALTKHEHNERWGTSNSSYGVGAAEAQPKMLTN
jgi:DnaJ-class molecular chaperone